MININEWYKAIINILILAPSSTPKEILLAWVGRKPTWLIKIEVKMREHIITYPINCPIPAHSNQIYQYGMTFSHMAMAGEIRLIKEQVK